MDSNYSDASYSDASSAAERARQQDVSGVQADLLASSDVVIPLIQEELDVRKELVTKGTVRFTKVVHEMPAAVNDVLTSEHVEVERIPFDQVFQEVPAVRMEGDVMIIPIVEEVLVVTKQFRLKEEIRIVKKRTSEEFHQEFTVRSEELTVERR